MACAIGGHVARDGAPVLVFSSRRFDPLMTNDKENGNGIRVSPKQFWSVLIMAAAFGNTGSVLQAISPNTRADPFTGTMAREMKRELVVEIHDAMDLSKDRHLEQSKRLDRHDARLLHLERVILGFQGSGSP